RPSVARTTWARRGSIPLEVRHLWDLPCAVARGGPTPPGRIPCRSFHGKPILREDPSPGRCNVLATGTRGLPLALAGAGGLGRAGARQPSSAAARQRRAQGGWFLERGAGGRPRALAAREPA